MISSRLSFLRLIFKNPGPATSILEISLISSKRINFNFFDNSVGFILLSFDKISEILQDKSKL